MDRYSKSALAISGEHGSDVREAVLRVTERWNRQHEREIKDARAATRRDDMYAKPETVSQKDAAAECMQEAYLKASTGGTLPTSPRQIYYAARDHIQSRSGKTPTGQYFGQTLLVDYMDEHPEKTAGWDIAWDARGNLIEPHSGKRTPLSTLAVRKYVAEKGWRNNYGAVLFCEKEGFQPLFEAVKLAERYDIAIMSTKGVSTTAARTLIDALIRDGIPVYCIRDFDFTGFNIAGTLARNTRRYAWVTAGALDLGLRLGDVERHGLAKERAFHKSGKRILHTKEEIRAKIVEPLRANGATEEEITFLETHRVELNAFTSGDLVKWTEAKLVEHGVMKVVPDDATLAEEARQVARDVVVERILAEKAKEIDAEVAGFAIDGLATRIRDRFAVDPDLPWTTALAGIVRTQIGQRPMSAPASWAFGRCGPILEANGFHPLPISLPHPSDPDLGKKPPGTLSEWQHAAPVGARLPRYARCGTGILTATTPAVDFDVRHAELADALDRMVAEMAGDAPVRFGQAPKRLRVYRTAEPFAKLSTAGYRLPGDQPGAKAHKLEVLAAGQQFVAYGVHPGTGRPYAWPDDELLDLERDDLPELTAALAARVVTVAEVILAKAGTVASSRASSTRPAAERIPGPPPRPVRDLAEARRVLDVLRRIDPSGLDRDTWIRTAYGVKAALGEHGREAWITWSSRSAKHGASGKTDTPARMWARVDPQRCGWRFLERLASEIARG